MRGRVLIWTTIVLLGMAGVVAAQQEPRKGTIKDVVALSADNKEFAALIIGGGRALESVNIYLDMAKSPMLFCVPKNLAITGDQYIRILSAFIEKNPKVGNLDLNSLGFGLILAMIDVFPCKQ